MPTTTPVQPHVLLVATPFQSHVNPLMRLGRRLAAKGVLVTFTTALRAGIRLDEVSGVDGFRVERLRGGDLWEPDDPRFVDASDMARHLSAAGPAALEALIRREAAAGRPVTCVVANAFVPWALPVAADMGLPRAMLWIQSCALLSVYYHYLHALAPFPDTDDASGSVAIPGLPDLAIDELRPLLIYTSSQDMWRQMVVTDLGSVREKVSWLLVNTFDALEHEAIAALSGHVPVIPVGPLLEPETAEADGCVAWLDAQPPRSVVLVAFGSLVKTGDEETAEIAEALAGADRPFLWVLRDENRALLSKDTLAAATSRGRGRVVPWCRQARVLAHGAVGCFVTHCGWNSTTEALAAGVPVVACTRWSDQRINAKFLVDVYRVGVRSLTPVTRESLRLSIEEVMGGPEAEGFGLRAASLKKRARAALADGGSSDNGVQAFVDQISELARSGGG
ncbi:gallate 1-beta-glucosyltransferase-like [Lolium rigidum]|uniref:gallate 1-beta-glucosyltransferase-like n=1 Tax=Lolium rigidum TaxID=89674 RepID=UPI001F5D44B2|nr:gallate 1-beta-glucosyltransferase-like [Lolium rigidum]